MSVLENWGEPSLEFVVRPLRLQYDSQMSNLAFTLPLALGVTVVLQATMNRSIGFNYGLSAAVALNAVVFFVLSIGFFLLAKYNPMIVPDFVRVREPSESFSWLYLIPGTCGFMLVLGLPWSIQNIGPTISFLLLIASQVVVSFALEIWQAGGLPSLIRVGGAALILAGSYLVVKS